MELICKINVQSYGFIDTKEIPVTLEKDKTYILEKAYNDAMKMYYYNVIDNGELITTLSENEKELFFQEN